MTVVKKYTDQFQVVAAATFGAVIRSRDTNFTVGDGKHFDGRRARTTSQLFALEKYSDVLLDYCHFGDPMCAVGSTPENVEHHLNYFVQHNEEVIKWFVSMAKTNKGTENSGNTPTRPQSGASSSVAAKPAATASAKISPSATTGNEAPSAQKSPSIGDDKLKLGTAASFTINTGFAAVLAGVIVALL